MNDTDLRQLERLLTNELGAYQQYSTLIDREYAGVMKYDSELVIDIAAQRSDLSEKLTAFNEQRKDFLRQNCWPEARSLSQVVSDLPRSESRQRLQVLVSKLRQTVNDTQRRARELRGLVGFSLHLVNGTASLIHSATQSVTPTYGPQGKAKNIYTPRAGQDETLRQA